MKRVLYRQLTIKNFLSIGSEPVVVKFSKGIHIITGVNKDKVDRANGVGKSTIADAFYFAHFGETIRNIKKELIVNDVTNGKVEVILDVDVVENGVSDSYQISRNLKPSKIEVKKNGVDITLDSIANTNTFIQETLSISPSVMLNCVVTTVNETIPFMAKSKQEKRKFIEDIFDLDVFGRMLTLLKREFSETKKTVDVKDAQVGEIKRTVLTLQDNQKKLIDQRNERIAHYEKRKAENVTEKEKLVREIKECIVPDIAVIDTNIKKLLDAHVTVNSSLNRVIAVKNQFVFRKQQAEAELAKYQKSLEAGACPECHRHFDSQDDHEHASNLIAQTAVKIADFQADIDKIEIQQVSVNEKHRLINLKLEQLRDQKYAAVKLAEEQKTRTKRLESIDGWIKELDKDIETAKNAQDTFASGIKKEGERLRTEATELTRLQDHFKILDSARFVLGDEGVKTHIVKKLIDLLNSKLTYYIRRLDGNCVCKFNEYFEEEIINNKNKVRSYFNFSGAEKKAVDLAGLFAFSDIKRLQGGVSYNVSMYDELFDSALDETAVGLVIDVLKDRVEENDECVMIISHRKEAIKAVTGEVIYLEKRNDITRRVDYDENND